jgi:hypothetical protein
MTTETVANPLPYSRVFVNTGEPIGLEGLMEFRLLYQGELLPSGNKNTRPHQKHKIRRVLHPQLRRQWELHDGLRNHAKFVGIDQQLKAGISQDNLPDENQLIKLGIESIGSTWARSGYSFVPMLTEVEGARCAIHILLLRPDEKRFIFTQGDIDGQIKTILDALRLPRSKEEIGNGPILDDERPFFCLLEDDRLVSEVHIDSHQLLLLPDQRDLKPNDAFTVIHVKINSKYPGELKGGLW